MKPDWDDLGEAYEDSKKVVIGDVDCTTDGGKPLCEKFGVSGYPTIKYFNPPDTIGEVYEGDRSLSALKKFTKTLGPQCSVDTMSKCSKKQKEALQPYLDMPVAEVQAKVDEMKAKLDAAQSAHDELLKSLQAQFDASDKGIKALKEEIEPKLKLMKSAIPKSTEPEPTKDEV